MTKYLVRFTNGLGETVASVELLTESHWDACVTALNNMPSDATEFDVTEA